MTAERYAEAVETNLIRLEEAVQERTQHILEQLTIKDPTALIYPELAKRGDGKEGGQEGAREGAGEMERRVFEMGKEEDMNGAGPKDKKAPSKNL